jgi:hypothetical protein
MGGRLASGSESDENSAISIGSDHELDTKRFNGKMVGFAWMLPGDPAVLAPTFRTQ